MSDPFPRPAAPVDGGARIFRASLNGWQSTLNGAPVDDAGQVFFAPGRGWLEVSIMLSALALLYPLLAIPAFIGALRVRRAGNRKWIAGLTASLWCCFLGALCRVAMGLSVVVP